MSPVVPVHEFDPSRASEYRARSDFAKTAILVPLADSGAEVTLRAPFGREVMCGDFYIVASPDGAYGAAQAEFEAAHVEVAPNRWVKRTSVDAYRTEERCLIETHLADGTHEASVVADEGDWIVRQSSGEVMAVKHHAFRERYEASD
jgi:hypothetical protein